MTDHLPECESPSLPNTCICPELRACEQRVLSGPMSMPSYLDGRKRGYAAGLQAARDAVAAAQEQAGDINFCKDCADWSVAAIDALRGES